MSQERPETQQEKYLKKWWAAAGEDAIAFTHLTIEEMGAAREERAKKGSPTLADVRSEQSKKPIRSKTRRRR